MAPSLEARSLEDVVSAFGRLLGAEFAADAVQQPGPGDVDLLLQATDVAFAVEWKAAGDTANVGSAIRQLTELKMARPRRSKPLIPIVAVPFMGETGRRLCAEAGVSWIDLSGNAWIDAPGRQIHILGHPNKFASVGRPANVFAPRSSRVIRALLMNPDKQFSQAELVAATGVDKGRVSRLVRRLDAMGLVERVESGGVRIKEPALALEAWREAYDFEKHDIRRGHVAVRSSEELVHRIAEATSSAPFRWALTGLAGAWYLTGFAMFRLTTVYVDAYPSDDWFKAVGYRDEPRGANVWIVRPVDDAVFQGASDRDGVTCAHPLQVYLDLKAHPERAQEAAEELRKRILDRTAA